MIERECGDDFYCGSCPDCLSGEHPENRPRYDVVRDDRRYHECGHSTIDHTTDFQCPRRIEYARRERERVDEFGPCPACEYGLPMGCNHPLDPDPDAVQ